MQVYIRLFMDFSIKSYYEKYDLYIYRKTDAKYKEEKVKKSKFVSRTRSGGELSKGIHFFKMGKYLNRRILAGKD